MTGGIEAAGGGAGGDGEEELGDTGRADITGAKHGFNLSIDTIQGLLLRSKVNVLLFLSRTLKGPI